MMRKQEPPNTVQIELTEGCNRTCGFCGVRGIRKDNEELYLFMNKNTAERIASQIAESGWKSKLLFAMHGEPTLNPNILRIIKLFRRYLPKSHFSVFTNGYGIAKGDITIDQLKEAGINNLMIDMYTPKDDGHKIKSMAEEQNIPYEVLGKGVPLISGDYRSFRLVFAPPIAYTPNLMTHKLCNHCGAAFPLDHSYDTKKCTRPFREMSFRYDGSVAICCNDFRGQYPIGSIMENTIEELWQSKRFNAARILLYAGERSFTPCYGCSATSVRVGLLPDKLGKETLPKPSDKIREFAKSISRYNSPLCGDNWHNRSWENDKE